MFYLCFNINNSHFVNFEINCKYSIISSIKTKKVPKNGDLKKTQMMKKNYFDSQI